MIRMHTKRTVSIVKCRLTNNEIYKTKWNALTLLFDVLNKLLENII